MTQSGWLAAALLAGFLLWLAMQGKLQAYWSILAGGAPAAPATTPAAATAALPAASGGPLIDLGPFGTFDPQLTGGGIAGYLNDPNSPLNEFHQFLFGR